MSDSPPDPFPFEPVPSATNRQDGWTPDRQRAFIAAFALIGMVSAAARAVGMSRKSAYALLERAGPRSSFARAWQAARSEGRARAEGTAIERAINGVEIPYFYRGEQRGVRRVYNDRLLIAALNAAARRNAAAREHVPSPSSPSSPARSLRRGRPPLRQRSTAPKARR